MDCERKVGRLIFIEALQTGQKLVLRLEVANIWFITI